MASDSRRLSILTAQEIGELYGLPRFTEDDRRLYFDLSPTERELVDIEAFAADYENEDFWRRSMQEGEDDSPESSMTPIRPFRGVGH